MKALITISATLLLSSPAFAQTLTVENTSSSTVVLGSYRGIKLPSICESTGYGFCWEEAFIKFKPLSSKTKNIKGSVTVDLTEEDHTVWLEVDGSQTEVAGLCENLSQSSLDYLQRLNTEIKYSDIRKVAVCFDTASVKIIID